MVNEILSNLMESLKLFYLLKKSTKKFQEKSRKLPKNEFNKAKLRRRKLLIVDGTTSFDFPAIFFHFKHFFEDLTLTKDCLEIK